jgi:hypothetical protein
MRFTFLHARGRRCSFGEHLQSFSVLFLIVVIGRSRAARGREQHERAVVRRCNHMTCHTPLFNTYSSHQQQLWRWSHAPVAAKAVCRTHAGCFLQLHEPTCN